MSARRDKRGRRIGRNWWREMNCEVLSAAEEAWQGLRESGQPIHSSAVAGAGFDVGHYQLEEREYRQVYPRPTLKAFLVANAGIGRRAA